MSVSANANQPHSDGLMRKGRILSMVDAISSTMMQPFPKPRIQHAIHVPLLGSLFRKALQGSTDINGDQRSPEPMSFISDTFRSWSQTDCTAAVLWIPKIFRVSTTRSSRLTGVGLQRMGNYSIKYQVPVTLVDVAQQCMSHVIGGSAKEPRSLHENV